MHARPYSLAAAAALAAAVAVPPTLAGPNEFKLDIRASRFEPGDVVTRTVRQTAEQTVVMKGADGAVLQQDRESFTIEYQALLRVVQVTSEGRPWRLEIHFSEFRRSEKGKDDHCLAGSSFEWVDVRVRRIAGTERISPRVQRWLDEEFSWGESADMKYDRVAALRPKGVVAVGGSWDGDGATIADHYAAWNPVAVDRKAAKAKCTLASATTTRRSSAVIKVEALVPLLAQVDYERRERSDYGAGSETRITASVPLRLDERIHTGTSTSTQVTTIRKDSGESKMEGTQKLVTETTLVLGGEFPAVPPGKGR